VPTVPESANAFSRGLDRRKNVPTVPGCLIVAEFATNFLLWALFCSSMFGRSSRSMRVRSCCWAERSGALRHNANTVRRLRTATSWRTSNALVKQIDLSGLGHRADFASLQAAVCDPAKSRRREPDDHSNARLPYCAPR